MMKTTFMLLAAAFVLSACSSPKNSYYTLSASEAPVATAMTHKTRILVGPVNVPSLVDTPQLVVKNSRNQVTVFEYHRWAGSLKTDIERVVAIDLARDLATPNVWSYTQSPNASFDYQVLIDVQNMDSKLGDAVALDVMWTVKPNAAKSGQDEVKGKRVITGRSIMREPVSADGFTALIAAQSRMIDRLSAEIAQAIRQQ